MRSMVVVGLLLLALVLVSTGCVAPGEGERGEFDTRYCPECKVYHPLDHPHFQEAEAPAEGPETQ